VERLWTPWRRPFVEGGDRRKDDCFLCTIAAQHDDRANLVLWRGPLAFVLMNLYPYTNGHLLVAPYLHHADLATLESSIANELMALTQRSVDVLHRAYRPEALNVGMNLGKAAGAGLPDHLHTHIVPRWNGDTSFMTVVGDTRVLPETLEETYERLLPVFHS
jgi:ATP adenylyltransferase